MSKYYFLKGRFDGPEYYADEVEDSEAEVSKRLRGKNVFLARTIHWSSISKLSGIELDDNRIFRPYWK